LTVVLSLLSAVDASAQVSTSKSSSASKKSIELKERPPELEGYGEHYDLAKYADCVKKTPKDSRCEVYRLKRIEAPEYWPFHKTSPMKWPDPPKEQVYKPGMGPIEYWRALCKAEAGEFIYKTIPNVTSIYQIRPRPLESEYSGSDRYVREDPYGYISSEAGTLTGIPFFVSGDGWRHSKFSTGGYPVFETAPLVDNIQRTSQKYFSPSLFSTRPNGVSYQRFSGYTRENRKTLRLEYVSRISSLYGWTWRGIRRALDREIGVAGGELAVVNLKTGEILGIRRGFQLGARELGGRVGWGGGNVCPEYQLMPGIGANRGRSKDMDFSFWFINKVLIPTGTSPY
jgi:hypothetical protein